MSTFLLKAVNKRSMSIFNIEIERKEGVASFERKTFFARQKLKAL